MIILFIYLFISFIVFLIFADSIRRIEEAMTIIFLWPILLIKELLKALFKLLFNDWK